MRSIGKHLAIVGAVALMMISTGCDLGVGETGRTIPPRVANIELDAITVSQPDAQKTVTVTGTDGAVPRVVTVIISNENQGLEVSGNSTTGGAFELRIPALPGEILAIRYSFAGITLGPVSLVVPPDTTAPDAPNAELIEAYTTSTGGATVVAGVPGAVEPGTLVVIQNSAGPSVSVEARDDGSFWAETRASIDDTMTIISRDDFGNASEPASVTVEGSSSLSADDFYLNIGVIDGAVFDKWSSDAIVGANVHLSMSNGREMVVTTGAGGTYAFSGLPPTKYTITVDVSGSANVAAGAVYQNFKIKHGELKCSLACYPDPVTGGPAAGTCDYPDMENNIDFPFGQLRATIEGQVLRDLDVVGLAGVQVSVMRGGCAGPTTGCGASDECGLEVALTTNAAGQYSITGVEEGFDYCVEPALPNWSFAPADQDVYALEGGTAITFVDDFVATQSSTADAINPYLLSVAPTKDANLDSTQLGSNITLEFSEELANVGDINLQARLFLAGFKGEADTAEPSWVDQVVTRATTSTNNDTIVIDPVEDLLPGARYTVIIGNGTCPAGTNCPYTTQEVQDLAYNAFDGTTDGATLPPINPIGANAITYQFTTAGGAATLIAPTQPALTADNSSQAPAAYTTSVGRLRFSDSDILDWDPVDGTVDGATPAMGPGWLALEWPEQTGVRGYKVYARPSSDENWEDITSESGNASTLTGYPGFILGRKEVRWAASLANISACLSSVTGNCPNVSPWDIDNTQWNYGMEFQVVVAPIDSNGAIVPVSPTTTTFTVVHDNTPPFVWPNAGFYDATNGTGLGDVYALDTAALTDGSMADNLVAPAAVNADTIDFQSIGDLGTAVFATPCCEFGLGLYLVQFNEPLEQSATNIANIRLVNDWNMPLSCGYETGIITADPNLSGASSVNSIIPTGDTVSVDETEPNIIERQFWKGVANQSWVALMVDDSFTVDSGDLIRTTGLTDMYGNVAGDNNGDGDTVDAGVDSQGWNPFTSFLVDADPNNREAQIADNVPPMVKTIEYVDGDGATQDQLIIELTEKVDLMKGLGFTYYTDPALTQAVIDAAAATFLNAANMDNGTNLAGFGDGSLGDASVPSNYSVSADLTTITFDMPDISFMQDGGTVLAQNMCGVELNEQTGTSAAEFNCNADNGTEAYQFLTGFAYLRRDGAYQDDDGAGNLIWGTNTLNTGLAGNVGILAGFTDLVGPRFVGATIAGFDMTAAANSVGYDNTAANVTPQNVLVYVTEPLLVDATANSATQNNNWTPQIRILNWDPALAAGAGDCDGTADGWGGLADVALTGAVLTQYTALYGAPTVAVTNIVAGAGDTQFTLSVSLTSGTAVGNCQFGVQQISAGAQLQDVNGNGFSQNGGVNTLVYNQNRERPVGVVTAGFER